MLIFLPNKQKKNAPKVRPYIIISCYLIFPNLFPVFLGFLSDLSRLFCINHFPFFCISTIIFDHIC